MVTMATEISNWHVMEKTMSTRFFQSPLIGSLSNLQITRAGIKSRMSSNLGRVGLCATELFALDFEWGKWCLHLFSVTMNSVFIKLTGKETGIKSWTCSNFGRMPFRGENSDVASFSQSPLFGSMSNLQVTRTGIKARTSSSLGRIGLFTSELFALEH